MTAARLRRGKPLAAAIGASLSRSSSGAPLVCAAAMALALGFTAPAEAGSIFTVNTALDPGPGGTISLRQAIALASGSSGNTVQFDASLVGSTITLAGTEIPVTMPMYIQGPGRDHLTISGNNASRIFQIESCSGTGHLKLSGVTLTSGASTSYGGAVYANGCGLELLNSRITASHAQNGGGAIASNSAYGVSLDNATISGNSAPNGGAIYTHGNVNVNRSSILGNTAVDRGGGIYMASGYLTMSNSTISGNSVTSMLGYGSYLGGGIFLSGTRSLVEDSTIAYNYASDGGGGVYLQGGYAASHATFKFTTIVGNSSCCYDQGNGISASGGQAYLNSTIVANNFNRGGMYDLAGFFAIISSLVRSPGSATIISSSSLFGVDPKLGLLKDNGGPTWTLLPAANSPVIDAGPACSDVNTEQRGVRRCVNGHLDMGSVERQNPEDFIFRDNFDPSP